MQKIFKKLVEDHAIAISEHEYNDLVANDRLCYGQSISLVKNNGMTFVYIPCNEVRLSQFTPFEFKLPPMTEAEKNDFVQKFKKAMASNQ